MEKSTGVCHSFEGRPSAVVIPTKEESHRVNIILQRLVLFPDSTLCRGFLVPGNDILFSLRLLEAKKLGVCHSDAGGTRSCLSFLRRTPIGCLSFRRRRNPIA